MSLEASPAQILDSLKESKPGWLSRIFHIEPGRLIACDATQTDDDWVRGETFEYLFRSKRGKFFLLTDPHEWSILTDEQARETFGRLPLRLVSETEAFEPVEIEQVEKPRDEEDDSRPYKVVRNDKWEFSIWLDYKDIPDGWHHIGMTGQKYECLNYIEQNCVFGRPNPSMQ